MCVCVCSCARVCVCACAGAPAWLFKQHILLVYSNKDERPRYRDFISFLG